MGSVRQNADCFLGDVIRYIVESNYSNDVHEKWRDLAILLETNNQTLKNIRRNSTYHDSSLADILETILLEWKCREGSAATIELLVKALEEIEPGVAKEISTKLNNNLSQSISLTSRPSSLYLEYTRDDKAARPLVTPTSEDSRIIRTTSCISCMNKSILNSEERYTSVGPPAHLTKFKPIINFILSIIIGFVIGFILAYLSYLVYTIYIGDGGNETRNHGAPLPNLSLAQSIGSIPVRAETKVTPTTTTVTPLCVHIFASTAAELRSKLFTISDHISYCLTIEIFSDTGWDNIQTAESAASITELTVQGHIQMPVLDEILRAMPSLEILHIINSNNSRCNSYRPTPVKKIALNKLQILFLDGFVFCEEIFSFLHTKVLMPNLRRLEIRGGSGRVSNRNKKFIQEFLESIRFFLKSLVFHNTTFDSSLFTNFSKIFFELKKIHIDFLSAVGSMVYLGNRFATVMPNIEQFSSQLGYLPLIELSSILKLTHIQDLNIGLQIPAGATFYKNITDKALETLQNIKLRLNFTDTGQCYISEKKIRQFQKYCIYPNCNYLMKNGVT